MLGDYEPLFLLRKLSASDVAKTRQETIEKRDLKSEYLGEYVELTAAQNFLNANQNYPLLQGTQSNLYKCFLPQAWTFGNKLGVTVFLHPEGVYDDPNGGTLRAAIYERLRAHFQFRNEFTLFVGTNDHGRMRFSLNVFASKQASPRFVSISYLFWPTTIDESFGHHGNGVCGGIKDADDHWNIRGHATRERIWPGATLRHGNGRRIWNER